MPGFNDGGEVGGGSTSTPGGDVMGGEHGFNQGGLVGLRKHFAGGGRVGGDFAGPNVDTVPALLTRGEYGVRRPAVQQPGILGIFNHINNGMVTHRATGGMIGTPPPAGGPGGGRGGRRWSGCGRAYPADLCSQ